jgi:hypothetical protein
MDTMNMPGLTAEASLYASSLIYRLNSSHARRLNNGVSPQLPPDLWEIYCRRKCYQFRPRGQSLRECLDEC